MGTNAKIGHGTKFKRSADGTSSGTLAALAAVQSIGGFALSRDTIDTTDMDSQDKFREYIGGLRDGGEIVIGMQFDPQSTDFANAISDFNADTSGYYQIEFPDGSTFGFSAILTTIPIEPPLDDKMMVELTYKISGKPEFVAGT